MTMSDDRIKDALIVAVGVSLVVGIYFVVTLTTQATHGTWHIHRCPCITDLEKRVDALEKR